MLVPFFAYTASFLIGMLCAAWYGKELHRFNWKEYLLMLLFPTIGLLGLVYVIGRSILMLFLVSAFLAPFGEWLVGYLYHRAFGARLWVYQRYSINGYTSLLVMPLWGFVSVAFFLFIRTFFPSL